MKPTNVKLGRPVEVSPKEPKSSSSESDSQEIAFVADVLRTEAQAILRVADELTKTGEDHALWKNAVDLLANCTGHVIVSGMGKSGLIGAKMSATMTSLGQPSSVVHPSEAMHGDLGRISKDDIVILLSASGETEEIVNLAAILREDKVKRLGISCAAQSTLARLCDVHLCMGDLTEACPLNLAPTTSSAVMLAIGDALALAVSRRRNFGRDDFQRRHPGGLLGVGLRPITEVLRFRVGENLPVVKDDVTVGEALKEAPTGRRTGAIVIVDDNGRLAGIFTDADLRRLVCDNPNAMNEKIRAVMTKSPKHLSADDLVRDAVQMMRERRLDEIPVLDADGRPIGIVDVQDLIAMKIVRE